MPHLSPKEQPGTDGCYRTRLGRNHSITLSIHLFQSIPKWLFEILTERRMFCSTAAKVKEKNKSQTLENFSITATDYFFEMLLTTYSHLWFMTKTFADAKKKWEKIDLTGIDPSLMVMIMDYSFWNHIIREAIISWNWNCRVHKQKILPFRSDPRKSYYNQAECSMSYK